MGSSYVFVFQSLNKCMSQHGSSPQVDLKINNNLKPPPSIADHQQYPSWSPEDSFETSSSSPKEKHGAPQKFQGERSELWHSFPSNICVLGSVPLPNKALGMPMGFYFRHWDHIAWDDFQMCKPFLDNKLPAIF